MNFFHVNLSTLINMKVIDFNQSVCLHMNPDNRWVKMAEINQQTDTS